MKKNKIKIKAKQVIVSVTNFKQIKLQYLHLAYQCFTSCSTFLILEELSESTGMTYREKY